MKKILVLFAVLLSINVFGQIITNGLERYYPFTGNANDVSGNAQHGSVMGATLTTDRFGNSNAAYLFNSGSSNYISIPSGTLNMNQYSYSAWVYLNSFPSSDNRSWVLSIGSTTGDQFLDYNNNYTVPVPTANGWGSGGYNITSPHGFIYADVTAALNQWYHLVVTRSATASIFYINGTLVDSVTVSGSNTPYYGSGSLTAKIGIRFDDTKPFDGKIDDLGIFNRPLTQTEVMVLYQEGLGITTIDKNDLSIYPNPTKGMVTINLSNNIDLAFATIKVMNITGEVLSVKTVNTPKYQFDFSGMANGTYLVEIQTINGNSLQRVVVQN